MSCGATSNHDLDTTRALTYFEANESYVNFFQHMQRLEHDYEHELYQYQEYIPHTKIVKRFVSELMRAQEYQIYLNWYYKEIVDYCKRHGEHLVQQRIPGDGPCQVAY